LLGAAETVLEASGEARLFHHEQYRRALMLSRGTLGESALTAERAVGRALPLGEALAEALADAATPAPVTAASETSVTDRAARSGLTPRELEVLRLLAEGRSDREIAAALFIGHRTVMTHVANILNKLGVDSRTAAATHAVRHDLV
jgi:DNA-binding NarL/FixJ family response regulator